ncbi:MAG: hypothetical protein EHM49_02760 [Deltaproteobacteria bacterium]|nr:MAG: hypothetical protein EHM49_02760 [Deltaproteobacteria bacterium]
MRDHFFLHVFNIVPVELGWEFLSASLADHSSVISLALYSDRTVTYQATKSTLEYNTVFSHNSRPVSVLTSANLTQEEWRGIRWVDNNGH